MSQSLFLRIPSPLGNEALGLSNTSPAASSLSGLRLSRLSPPLPVCEVQIRGRCLSPYAGGDLTRPSGQPRGWRRSPLHPRPWLPPARPRAQPPPAPSPRPPPATADAKQRKIFLKLQHLAPWQPPPAGGPGVSELPLGTSHGLASDPLSGLPFRAKLSLCGGSGGGERKGGGGGGSPETNF